MGRMGTLPKISVITPSFNQGGSIAYAIESVASQEYPYFEHIVVDAQSTDETLEVLQRYGGRERFSWSTEADEGQVDSINKGLLRATGDIVAWLSADGYYLPGTFEEVCTVMGANAAVDVLYGDVVVVDPSNRRLGVRRAHRFDLGVLLYNGNYIPSAATFLRRNIIDSGHLLDPNYSVTADYEFYIRLALAKYRFQYLPQVLAAVRCQDGSASRIQQQLLRQEFMSLRHRYGFRVTSNRRVQAAIHESLSSLFRLKRAAHSFLGRRRSGVSKRE